MNVGFHVLNALGWFLLLAWMTRTIWPPALVALLFALHPMHVESVAWISERKDVLSTLFWIATLWAWVAWVRTGRSTYYGGALLAFALGLMAKPMLVTLPFALLLFDFWPLSRLSGSLGETRKLVVEKLPLFALSFAASALTYFAHAEGGSMQDVAQLGLVDRVGNAAVAYTRYLGKGFLPTNLSSYYPYTGAWSAVQILGSLGLLIAISAAAFWQRQRRPYLIVGWLFFLGTLVPTIGLVQVGGQSMAERYTYVPYIGLFLSIAWAASDVIRVLPNTRAFIAGLAALALLACAVQTRTYVAEWQNTLRLFSHTLQSYPDNPVALVTVGRELTASGDSEHAIGMFERAIELAPGYSKAHYNLGDARLARREFDAAAAHYESAVQITPNAWYAWLKLGVVQEARRRPADAESAFRAGLALRPEIVPPRCRLAQLLARRGERAAAEVELRTALQAARSITAAREVHLYARELGFAELTEQSRQRISELE